MSDAIPARRTALYGRTSADVSEGRSVDDQLATQRRWAESAGRVVVAELRDDGISASRYAGKSKKRPDWQKAMELISNGEVDELSVWEISRSTRDRPVWAALIGACIEAGVDLVVDGKVHDPADPDDGFMLDLGAAMSVRESALTSKRTRRAAESRAAAGRPHGTLPYGYRRILDPVTGKAIGREFDVEQQPVVREIFDRLLAREPAHAIATDLNRRGVPTATGVSWRGGNLAKLALRPSYAGLRTFRGQILPDVRATWPPIITEEEFFQVVALFADPARDKFRQVTYAKHLGTGIYRCGRERCEGRMRVVASGARSVVRYDCRVCHRVSRHKEPVDAHVEELAIRYLQRDGLIDELTRGNGPDEVRAADEAERLTRKLANARAAWDADLMSLESYLDMERRTLPRIEKARAASRTRTVPAVVLKVIGANAQAAWKLLTVVEKREVLAALFEITILPAGRGQWRFDPELIQVRRASSY